MRKPRENRPGRAGDSAGETPDLAPGEVSEAEQQESLQRVEAGGIPLGAERRLRELGEHGGCYTSDLSVADFALCHKLSLRPLAQVMGSSIYQVGYQNTPWPMSAGGFMFELNFLSDAWNEVRRRALNRLALEAGHLNADAVVGVELRTGAHDWAENSIEYVVIGTAVRHGEATHRDGAAQGGAAAPDGGTVAGGGAPVLTELSVDDYWKLAQAGIEPLGVVAWSSAFFVRASYNTQMLGGLGGTMGFTQNQELPEYTEGFYEARELVMERMTAQAAQLGATGVVGVRVNHGIQRFEAGAGRYAQGGLMVTFHALGTAIREHEAATLYAPQTTIDLLTSQRSAMT
ncbi:MAG TPA: heavy metal-binding domain-containing protein [Solirubrobacteraceae bacterium]|jgi:uncharacterized protein YbjQ (UPF0145 family)